MKTTNSGLDETFTFSYCVLENTRWPSYDEEDEISGFKRAAEAVHLEIVKNFLFNSSCSGTIHYSHPDFLPLPSSLAVSFAGAPLRMGI